jgi:hypothetical protein
MSPRIIVILDSFLSLITILFCPLSLIYLLSLFSFLLVLDYRPFLDSFLPIHEFLPSLISLRFLDYVLCPDLPLFLIFLFLVHE